MRGRDLAVGDVANALARLDSWQTAIQRAIAMLEQEATTASAAFKGSVASADAMSARIGEAVVKAAADKEARSADGAGTGGAGRRRGGVGGFAGALSTLTGIDFGGDASTRRGPRR